MSPGNKAMLGVITMSDPAIKLFQTHKNYESLVALRGPTSRILIHQIISIWMVTDPCFGHLTVCF